MPKFHDKIGEQPQPTGGGMRQVMADGSESLAELRDFMGNLRGKSPQEVLGAVANSSLARSTFVSAIGFVVVIFGFSVVAHYWPGSKDKAKAADAQPKTSDKAKDAPAGDAGTPLTAQSTGAGTPADATQNSGDPTLDNLGIGETKATDPKKNPLEDSLDNLLDDAK